MTLNGRSKKLAVVSFEYKSGRLFGPDMAGLDTKELRGAGLLANCYLQHE